MHMFDCSLTSFSLYDCRLNVLFKYGLSYLNIALSADEWGVALDMLTR